VHDTQAAPDDPANYAQYTEYTQQGQQVGGGGGGARGTSAPVQRNVPVVLPAAQAPERALVHSAPANRAGVGAEAAVPVAGAAAGGGGAGGADDGIRVHSATGSSASSGNGKKSAGSGFFSSLFGGLMGGQKAALFSRGRSAPVPAVPDTAEAGASRPPAGQEAVPPTQRGRAGPTSAPEARRDAAGVPAMLSSGVLLTASASRTNAASHSRPASSKSQAAAGPRIPHPPLSPSPAVLAGGTDRPGSGGGGGRPVPSSAKGSGSRATSTLSRIAEQHAAGTGGGEGGEAGGAGWEAEEDVEALQDLLQTAAEGIGDAAWELFELAKMGDLSGLQNLVLTLSLGGKANDVVTMRDAQGLTLLHWAAREGHLEMVKYLVFEANADVLLKCNRGLKPAQHAREQWWMKNARLLEAFEFNRDEQARCIQGCIRQIKARASFGLKHMAACNIQALVRGKLEMLRQKHVWHYSNMWFNPENYTMRMATIAALEANEALAAEARAAAGADRGGGDVQFQRVSSANFRRVASLPSAWGGSAQEGRHMLLAMIQAPLRRRLRAGEWEVDLPGGVPPQNLQQYMSHNATVLAAVVRRRLAIMAYHTARVWLRKTGQASHQTWANLLALNRRPLVGADKRMQDRNTELAVAHAMQTALSTASAAGWTIKAPLQGGPSPSEHTHANSDAALAAASLPAAALARRAPRFGGGHRPLAATSAGVLGGGSAQGSADVSTAAMGGAAGETETQAHVQTAQYDAVAGFLETGTWAGMASGGGGGAGGADGGAGLEMTRGSSEVHGRIYQADVTPIFKNRAYVYRRQAKRAEYEASRNVAREQLRIKTEFEVC
jgi:hypothetical protein